MVADSHTLAYPQGNPFTPVFGRVPPFMAGREQIISDILAAFDHPDNDPNRCSLFVGARGTGKTALITYLSHEAEERGWVTANVTAGEGMLQDILECVVRSAGHPVSDAPHRRITSVGLSAIGSIAWENQAPDDGNWRSRMNSLLDALVKTGSGLLITVDEVDPSFEELAQLVTTYQHFIRENRRVVLLLAGLPHRINGLLSGKSTSFLRRAARHTLGSIPPYEVQEAFRLTVESGGKTIDDDALAEAVHAIDGFPFMFQLVGYRSWNAAALEEGIGLQRVEQGVALAQRELSDRVFTATYAELSRGDKDFLRVMARAGERVTRGEIAAALRKSSSHVSAYKRRLLEAGVIEEVEPGVFTFALPGFRAYLLSRE